MDDTPLTLLELNHEVKAHLEAGFRRPLWVQAELSAVSTHGSGHCYLELVQKATRGDSIVAKARGIIWRDRLPLLRHYFESETGQRLSAGLKVMVQVVVQFSELYGYSLIVHDIDPAFTLGELALRRRAIIRQLTEDGIVDMNRELPFPELPQRVAVVSSPTAAGYGDFCRQLADNGQGFGFRVELFPAMMQGREVERSVIAALDAIADRRAEFDVVVIIRGGGATSDLSDFDTLGLATVCAQFPLPLVTGIGHERDNTVIDEIAHTRVKTPTAAAALLIDRMAAAASRLTDLSTRLQRSAAALLALRHRELQALSARLPMAAARRVSDERLRLMRLRQTLRQSAAERLSSTDKRLAHLRTRLTEGSRRALALRRLTLSTTVARLRMVVTHRLTREQSRLQLLTQRVADNAPDRLLARGYSITLHDGRAVRHPAELRPGDVITTRLQGGEIRSTVNESQ